MPIRLNMAIFLDLDEYYFKKLVAPTVLEQLAKQHNLVLLEE